MSDLNQRPRLWPRMIAMLAATALGVYYIGHVILGYTIGGSDDFDIRVQVPEAPGVYQDGTVTYRGVAVGRIAKIDLTDSGVELVLRINAGEKIPADSDANVRELSALGEQYVDLVPRSTGGPVFTAGDVIPAAHTTVPVPIGKALTSGKEFLDSLDPADLASVENLLADAFSDVAPQLRRLITTGQDLTRALIAGQAGTRQLILDGDTVLRAGNHTSDDLRTYVASFDKLTKTFAHSDDDIAGLLNDGGEALTDIESLVKTSSSPWRHMLAGTSKVGDAVRANQAAVNALFALLPSVASDLGKAAPGGRVSGTLTLNDGQPLCSYAAGLDVPGAAPAAASGPDQCSTGGGAQMRGPAHTPGGGS